MSRIILKGVTTHSTMKLDELARRAGTTPRTVRYYVQRGLLPAPAFHGKDTAYGREHLVRLHAIRALQQRHMPLDEIEAELTSKTLEQIERLAETQGPPEPSDACHGAVLRTSPAMPGPGAPPSGGVYRQPAARVDHGRAWRRFVLADGLELHVEEGADASTLAMAEELLRQSKKSPG